MKAGPEEIAIGTTCTVGFTYDSTKGNIPTTKSAILAILFHATQIGSFSANNQYIYATPRYHTATNHKGMGGDHNRPRLRIANKRDMLAFRMKPKRDQPNVKVNTKFRIDKKRPAIIAISSKGPTIRLEMILRKLSI